MNELLYGIVFGRESSGGLLYNKEKLWWDWKVWFESGDLGGMRRVLRPRNFETGDRRWDRGLGFLMVRTMGRIWMGREYGGFL
jgi:hypothetical protein